MPGAKEVAVEFNSLSKSHNMAGWRVGMAVGNATAIVALVQIKSNIDSGIFLAIQDAAVTALTGDQSWMAERNAEYQHRRDLILDVLVNDWVLRSREPKASLYLWPEVPQGYTSAEFADGSAGDGCEPDAGLRVWPGRRRVSAHFGRPDNERVMPAVERLRGFTCR